MLAVESQYTSLINWSGGGGLPSVIKKKKTKHISRYQFSNYNSAIMPINNSNNEDYYNKNQSHVMKVTTHTVSTRFQYIVIHMFRNPHRSTKTHVSWRNWFSLSWADQRWDMHVVGPSEYNKYGTGRNMSPYQMMGVHYTWKKKVSLLTLLKRESNVLATRDRYKIYRVGWL